MAALAVPYSVDHSAFCGIVVLVLFVFDETQGVVNILEDSHHLLCVDGEDFADVDVVGGFAACSDGLEVVPVCLVVGLAVLVVVVDVWV